MESFTDEFVIEDVKLKKAQIPQGSVRHSGGSNTHSWIGPIGFSAGTQSKLPISLVSQTSPGSLAPVGDAPLKSVPLRKVCGKPGSKTYALSISSTSSSLKEIPRAAIFPLRCSTFLPPT